MRRVLGDLHHDGHERELHGARVQHARHDQRALPWRCPLRGAARMPEEERHHAAAAHAGQTTGAGAGGLLGGDTGPVLPKGVTRTQYEAILKKCGSGFAAGRFGAGRDRFNSPEAKKALVKFAACMRENGVKIGEPNTSGKGAIFDTKGINTTSPQFAAAERKCQSYLHTAFGGRPGGGANAAPGAGTGAAPPGAETGAAPPAGAGG